MARIPAFPNSKKLALDDQNEIEEFVRKFPPYSDYNFTSLYCYNINEKMEVSWLNGNLVVLFQDYTSDEQFYSFLGENLVSETALTLLEHAEQAGVESELRLVPEHTINLGTKNHLIGIKEDRDNHDYIFSLRAVSELKGGKFARKRQYINHFRKNTPDHSICHLDLSDLATINKILTFSRELIERKTMLTYENHELVALERLFRNISHFNVVCKGTFIENELRSFFIDEKLHDGFVIGHFEKSDILFNGIQPFGIHESSKAFSGEGFSYLNFEQDLGIEGLRTMKERFRPVFYLKKFIIKRAK